MPRSFVQAAPECVPPPSPGTLGNDLSQAGFVDNVAGSDCGFAFAQLLHGRGIGEYVESLLERL